MIKHDAPRVCFCWQCGKVLDRNVYVEREVDGAMRILHKVCSEDIDSPDPGRIKNESDWVNILIDREFSSTPRDERELRRMAMQARKEALK